MSGVGSVRARFAALPDAARRRVAAAVLGWALLALAYLGAWALGARDTLSASYWTNPRWSGEPALATVDRAVRTDREALGRRLGEAQGYSAVWRGTLFAPREAEYLFRITSDDGSWVALDGAALIDNGGEHGALKRGKRVRLARGFHPLEIRYFDAGGLGMVEFSWVATASLWRPLPAGMLYASAPPAGRAAADWVLAVVRTAAGTLLAALTLVGGLVAGWSIDRRRLGEAVLPVVLFAALLGGYGARLFERRSTSVFACDSYAYLQGTVAMAAHGPLHSEIEDPLVPRVVASLGARPAERDLMFLLSPHGHYVADLARGVSFNVFPPGLMWLLLPVVAGFGASAALLVLPVLTLAFAAGFFLHAYRHVEGWFAACAAAFLAFNPVVFQNTVLLMSDVPSAVLGAACLYLLFRNLGEPHVLRPVFAGAAFGLALAVRYSNAALLAPALALFAIGWAGHRDRRGLLRDLGAFAAGSLVWIVPFALYTWGHYGTLLRLTYDPTSSSALRAAYLAPNVAYYAADVTHTFGLPALAIAAVGLGACVVRRERRPLVMVGLVALAAFFLPYSLERLRESRYLMPLYPWLALFYGFGALAVAGLARRVAALRVVILAALAVLPFAYASGRLYGGTSLQDHTSRLLRERAGADAVVFCDNFSGPVRLYAGLAGYRFTWTRREVLAEACAALDRLGRPVYFLLDSDAARQHFEWLRSSGTLPPGRVEPAGDVDGIALWRYVAPPRPGGGPPSGPGAPRESPADPSARRPS